jgi:hypothetical protein
VPVHEFQFSIELSGPGSSTDMLRELTRLVLGHVGCPGAVVEAAAVSLQREAAAAEGDGPVRVAFSLLSGHLEISVASGARIVWRTTHQLT